MRENDKKIKTELVVIWSSNFILVLLFVALAYFFFNVTVPAFKNIYSSALVLENLEKETAGLVKMVEDTKSSRNKLSSYFVSKESIISFIEELESLSRQANVVLSIDTPTEEKEAPQSKQVSLRFNIKTSGSWGDTMYFIRLVENLPYKIFTDRVFLSAPAPNSSLDKSLVSGWAGTISFRLMSYIVD